MNCAPVTVTGSQQRHKRRVHRHGAATIDQSQNEALIQKRASAMASLPNMFVANIGNGCSTAESGTTLAIPQQNLGNNVQRIGSDKPTPPVGSCGEGQAAAAGVPQPQASSPSTNPAPSGVAVPPAQAPSPSGAPQSPSPPPPPPAQPQAPAAPPAASPAPPPPIPSGLNSGSCTTPGKSVCSPGGKGIGTCDEFNRVIFAPAPLGTKCDQTLGVLVNAGVKMFKA